MTDEQGLGKLLGSGPQTVYIGFDPTSSSLHVGSMMQLMLLRRFQTAGHRPIALVGGATGMIGDPSGKSEERNLLSREQLQDNVDGDRGTNATLPGLRRRTRRYPAEQLSMDGEILVPGFSPRRRQELSCRCHDGQRIDPRLDSIAKRGSVTPSSATCCCKRTTLSTCVVNMAAEFKPAAATNGATSPPESIWAADAGRATVRHHGAVAVDQRRQKDGQDRVGCDLVGRRSHQPLRILSVLEKR